MSTQWTIEQKAAIETDGVNLLVSAAAGSGKTAVLVERIIEKITSPVNPTDIDRLLVVTFTNAAAAEMRERISAAIAKKLEENPSSELLARQMVLMGKAHITTIHSFCLDILRTHFNLAGIDPNFRIADQTEDALLRMEALSEVMDELIEDEEFGDSYYSLTENYSGLKSSADFEDLIQKIFHFVMSLPAPKKWLYEAGEKFSLAGTGFSGSPMEEMIVRAAKETVAEILSDYPDLMEKAKNDDGGDGLFLMLGEEYETLRHAFLMNDYESLRAWAHSVEFARFPSAPKGSDPRYREYIKDVRTKAKDSFRKDVADKLLLLEAKEMERVLAVESRQMRCLSELVSRLIDRFDEKKTAKNILNFNDLEHRAYRLFVEESGERTPLARSVSEQFDEILIDEYQDTSRLQEAIFAAIKKENNLFMVGDIKQSIYRFRNTDPSLFREKKETFSLEEGAGDRKCILSRNFRSRKEILFGINDIFEKLMSVSLGEIEYNEEEKLYPGIDYPDALHPVEPELELHIIDPAEDGEEESEEEAESLDRIEAEALLTAQKIEELIAGGYQVFTKSGYRTITYRDICILLRSPKNWTETFLRVLSSYGIPCYTEKSGGFLESNEVATMLSLLNIIDNPHQDIPLLSVLRSQMFAFSENDLAQIRICDRKGDFYDALVKKGQAEDALSERVRHFLEELAEARRLSGHLPLYELIWTLYQKTGFYDAQGTLSGGTLRRMNLRLLAMRAKEYEKTSFRGLYSFVRFIDNYRQAGGDYDGGRMLGEEQNVVRLMTIHKSKGLEFPVVILCGTGKQMNRKDLSKNVLIHASLGYGPKFIDPELRITYPTAIREIIKKRLEREMLSEEMRILYVALTRAREKLIVIGTKKNTPKYLYSMGIGTETGGKILPNKTLSAKSYLDWFVMALITHPACPRLRDSIDYPLTLTKTESPWTACIHSANELLNPREEAQQERQERQGVDDQAIAALVRYSYPFADDTTLATKITVTELKNSRLREENTDGERMYPRPIRLLTEQRKDISGAARGTLYHTAMQWLKLSEYTEEEISRQLLSMQEEGYFTEEERAVIEPKDLLQFYESEAGMMMRRADRVDKEVMFAIHIPAKEAYPEISSDEDIMLQGVIDCVMVQGGEITVLDYKTDYVRFEEEIAERYRLQLEYYARAAEKIYGLPVVRKCLYLFATGKLIEL
ncbi:MAG: helicase-exonuclease AddAB subunit AddA [Clostridia bacterium]|nr:helicase-exonuclease AddAB subunit AddA [Clostridia bacterium]